MKKFKLLKVVLLVLITSGSILSCKKDNDKKPSCKIITITPSSGDAVNITYNSEGKIASILTGTVSETFQYSGNTIVDTKTDGGIFESKVIITINDKGFATNVKTENNPAGTDWTNSQYDYNNGTQLIKFTQTSSSGGTPLVQTCTWSNGNLASITTEGSAAVTTLDYYTDKSTKDGDYLRVAELTSAGGTKIFDSKNALKSLLSGSSITSFSYDYDNDGKITKVTLDNGTPPAQTYSYQYQCN